MQSIISENITQYQIKVIKYRYDTINTKRTLISTNEKILSLTFTLKYRQSTQNTKMKRLNMKICKTEQNFEQQSVKTC